ncbi:MAG: PAS domain-containing protein [Verrucomicrobiota bacterium]
MKSTLAPRRPRLNGAGDNADCANSIKPRTSATQELEALRQQVQTLTAEIEDLRVKAEIINLTSIVSEGDVKGDIMTINQKFCDVSQYGKDELIGKPHNTTRHPDMPKEVFREMWATIGRGKVFRGVVKNRKKDVLRITSMQSSRPSSGRMANRRNTSVSVTTSQTWRSNAKTCEGFSRPSIPAMRSSNSIRRAIY